MRLHRLSMTAIGPFLGTVEIDFTRLGQSGLFLLEGPTGAGKSTVVDAISFALYGKVAQASAVAERLKSHHAPLADEPVVELVFETQSGVYRVRRTPSFDRPKKRGTGSLTASMTVKLWRLTSPDEPHRGELLSTNLGDAEDEITRAVGLTHAQFVQTVVLPQGEFANFLRADTTTKRALLQKLFGTELLARTQDQLIEGRRKAEQLRTAGAAAVTKAAHAFLGAAAVDEDSAAELIQSIEAGDGTRLMEQLAAVRAALLADEAATGEAYAAASSRRLTAQTTVQTAREVFRRRALRDQLRGEQQRLAAGSGAQAAACAELAAAERALAVLPAANALVTAIGRSDEAQDADSAARQRLRPPLRVLDEAALRAANAELRTSVGALAEPLRRERELAPLRAERHDALAERERHVALHNTASSALAELPQRQRALGVARDVAATATAHLPSLTSERDRAAKRLVAAERAAEAAELAAQNQLLTQEALRAAEEHEVRLVSLRNSWRASIASELGLALKSGNPCVVCGSVEHPQPARRAPDQVTRDDLDRAERRLALLHDTVQTRREELNRQKTELALLQTAADQLSTDVAAVQLDRAAAALATAQATAAELAGIEAELAECAGLATELAEQARQAALAETRLAERVDSLSSRIDQDERAVAAARADQPTVADRARLLQDEIRLIDDAATAACAADATVRAAEEAGAGFAAALSAAEFDGEPSWRHAARTSSQLAGLRTRIRGYEDEWAALVTRLSDPDLTDPELDAPAPELAELAESLRAAEADEKAAAALHGAAKDRRASSATHADRLDAALARSAAVLSQTAPAIRIGYLAAGLGDNQLKMDLTTYVLVRRFTEILSAANTQLRRISGGRYELEHTDARSGNARSGLGLRVLDLHTGRPRDPGTLSGGETFYVSLSLALGLADVVRAESGGIDLGTLFIDEGFGTLDHEVLDQVLVVLEGLREGGRVVGIISHVDELKTRVPDRIEVRRNPDGSSRLTITA